VNLDAPGPSHAVNNNTRADKVRALVSIQTTRIHYDHIKTLGCLEAVAPNSLSSPNVLDDMFRDSGRVGVRFTNYV